MTASAHTRNNANCADRAAENNCISLGFSFVLYTHIYTPYGYIATRSIMIKRRRECVYTRAKSLYHVVAADICTRSVSPCIKIPMTLRNPHTRIDMRYIHISKVKKQRTVAIESKPKHSPSALHYHRLPKTKTDLAPPLPPLVTL